ncbi:MAG: ABC transporter permease [Candidatus Cloacimonadota bacterium]|nr:ABC transporter permease [Candidatus Cloacimonadota bacterium]
MKWKNLEKTAFKSLFKNKMRSFLTSLGIIIGVSSVIVMVSIGRGTQTEIEEKIQSLGTNLLMVMPSASHRGGVARGAGSMNNMSLDDVKAIEENAEDVLYVSASVRSGVQIIGGEGNWNTSIEGVYPCYKEIKSWNVTSGDFFDNQDLKGRKKVCLLGQTIVDELFPNEDPVGKRIRLNKIPFTVIGILEEKGQTGMSDQDDIILAPATTVLYRLKGGTNINMIYASAISEEKMSSAEDEIYQILRNKHKIYGTMEDDFVIRSQTELTEMATSTTKTLTLLLGTIAGVSLLVGGIGIMNIMLVTITERTREIGIRLAVGARSKDILIQFLTEAILLSLVGGILGICFAFGITKALNYFAEIRTIIEPYTILISATFAGIVGIFFGYYPARKASKLNPIEALRYE